MSQLDQYIVSSCRGRMRLRCTLLKNPAVAGLVSEELKNAAGVSAFEINPTTGSLLLQFNPELFSRKEFESVFLKNAGQPVRFPNVCDKLGAAVKSKTMRKVENRGMLIFSAITVASIFTKTWKLHTWAGIGYVALSALHSYRYRKTLLR